MAAVVWALAAVNSQAQVPVVSSAPAQSNAQSNAPSDAPSDAPEPRLQASLTFDTNTSTDGTWFQLTPTAGFTFNDSWSVEVGVPLFRLNASATDEGSPYTGAGDVYASLSFDVSTERTTASATGTLGLPTGDAAADLGAGTTTWDLTGYLDRTWGRITPSVEVGIGNNGLVGAVNPSGQRLQASGHLLHAEAWAELRVSRPLRLSAGVYAIRGRADGSEVAAELDESSDDEGFQVVVAADVTRAMALSFWFSRSTPYAYNTYAVSLGVDLVDLFRDAGAAGSRRRRQP